MKFIKKHFKLIIFIVVCLLIYLIYKSNVNDNITYISLGDGFSMGINPYNESAYGYNDYLKDYLEKNNKLNRYYRFSYKDMTLKDLKKDILVNVSEKDENNIKESLRESNLLTMSLGLNDLIYKIDIEKSLTNTEKENIIKEIQKQLTETVEEIKKYYKYEIYVIGYYNFYPQKTVEKELLMRLNCELKNNSKRLHYVYVDNSNLNNKLSLYLENPDSIYPNNKGYKQIFNNILANLTIK